MPYPPNYTRQYNYTAHQTANPSTPLPADRVETDLDAIATAVNGNKAFLQGSALNDAGGLKNGVVTEASLAPGVGTSLGQAQANAAATSAANAATSANSAASSATAAASSATTATGSANVAAGHAATAGTASATAQTAATNAATSASAAAGSASQASTFATNAAGSASAAASSASAASASAAAAAAARDQAVDAINDHADLTNNPHNVTAAQVGAAVAQWNANRLQGRTVSTTPPTTGQTLVWDATLQAWVPAFPGQDENAPTPVMSVNGENGDVILTPADVGAAPAVHGHTIAEVTNLQASLDGKAPTSHTHPISNVTGLQTALDGKAASVHTHAISDTTGLQTALDGKAASVHTHAISDTTGLQAALDGKAASSHTHPTSQITGLDTLLAGKANTSHTHAVSDVTGLQTALDGKANTSHTHTIANVTGLQGALDGKLNLTGGSLTGGVAVSTTASTPVRASIPGNALFGKALLVEAGGVGGDGAQIHFHKPSVREWAIGIKNGTFEGDFFTINVDANAGSWGAQRFLISPTGQLWASNYGWLHDHFFSSVANCVREGELYHPSPTGNCYPGNVAINCYGGGNRSIAQIEVVDNGGQLQLRGVNFFYNCNCNCACNCNC